MSNRTQLLLKSTHITALSKRRQHEYEYRCLNRWQREAQGITKWDQEHSHRMLPKKWRFNPEGLNLTKGTSAFAWRWWHTQYPWLPNVPDSKYTEPRPRSICPSSWDAEFREVVLAMSNDEIKEYLIEKLTQVIFDETQRDGYELRRLDFEGKPLTALPERRIIESFVLEEETLRERVINTIIEGVFRLSATSDDRKELRSVSNIIDFILTHITTARTADSNDIGNSSSSSDGRAHDQQNRSVHTEEPFTVTEAAKAIMRCHPLQPQFGFTHALPTDNRDRVVREWERLHHLDWQFGNAVYEPRDEENVHGNLIWLREAQHQRDREAFNAKVASGKAKEEHLAKIKAASKSYVANTPDTNAMLRSAFDATV